MSAKYKVVFRALEPGVEGQVEWTTPPIITIDLAQSQCPASTFLHERFHIRYPNLSEKRILQLEERAWKRLSRVRRYGLYKELFRIGKFEQE